MIRANYPYLKLSLNPNLKLNLDPNLKLNLDLNPLSIEEVDYASTLLK